jgi:hypothetical protein
MAREWSNRSLKILAVKVTNIPLKSAAGETLSQDKFLLVTVEISNTASLPGPNSSFLYMTLRGVAGASGRTHASLSDSDRKFYNRINFGQGVHPAGSVFRSAALGPGKKVRDILVFELPTPSKGPYRIEAPLGNLGGVGAATWEIPESAMR